MNDLRKLANGHLTIIYQYVNRNAMNFRKYCKAMFYICISQLIEGCHIVDEYFSL